jgi:intein/homing endonuclease
MKLYYKIPLDTVNKTIVVRDKFNERTLYNLTEQEYLELLYNEGRCNIKYIDDKPRNELVLIIGRRGSKCEVYDYEFYTTAGTLKAKELHDRIKKGEKIGIHTYDPHTWEKKITYDIISEENGVQESYELVTKLGRSDKVSYNHPYYVWREEWDAPRWVEAKDIIIGDTLAVSKSSEIFGKESIGLNKSKLLGYLMGDGGLTSGVKFTNMDNSLIEDIQHSLDSNFPNHRIKSITGAKFGYNIVCEDKKNTNGKNLLKEWLSEIGVYGLKAVDKFIPECIKKAPKEEIAIFLNRLFACDGYVIKGKTSKDREDIKIGIGITLASKKFIKDIQKELLKFGIVSSWNYHISKIDDKEYDSWKLYIYQKDSILKFKEFINIYSKEDKIESIYELAKDKLDQNNPLNLMPKGAWNRILSIKKERNLSNASIIGKFGIGHNDRLRTKYRLSKIKAVNYAKNIDDLVLYNLAKSDVCWDTVEEINFLGNQPTIALEVKDTNIIGNDIISHNSTITSWIAAYETYKLLKSHHPQKFYGLLPDAEIYVTTVATSEDQANLLFRQILGHYAQCTYFHRYMNRPTADKVLIRSRRDLEKYGEEGKSSIIVRSAPCSARGLRGAGNILVIMDEQAHFVDEKSQSNKSDKAVYDAITPSVAQFGNDGKIINISSPLNKSGMLWDLYCQSLDGAENILMIQAPSWEINTTLSSSFLKGRYQQDPIAYDCEFGAQFSDRVKSWMPEEYLRRVIVPGLSQKLMGMPRQPYFVGLDVGFKDDGTAIAISHVTQDTDDNGKIVDKIELDYVGWRQAGVPPYENRDILDFSEIAEWIKETCQKFYAVQGLLDQHNGVMVHQNLHKLGLTQFEMVYHTRNFNSQLYQNFMMLCIDKKLRIFNDKPDEHQDSDLIDELLKLQVVQYSKNVISVESPKLKGNYDDRSDAIMRSVWLASEAIRNGFVSSNTSSSDRSRNSFGVYSAQQYQLRKQRFHNIHDNRRNPNAIKKRGF